MKKIDKNAIVGNIGHVYDEIDMAGLGKFDGTKVKTANR